MSSVNARFVFVGRNPEGFWRCGRQAELASGGCDRWSICIRKSYDTVYGLVVGLQTGNDFFRDLVRLGVSQV